MESVEKCNRSKFFRNPAVLFFLQKYRHYSHSVIDLAGKIARIIHRPRRHYDTVLIEA